MELQHKDWSEDLEIAKKENKLVFVVIIHVGCALDTVPDKLSALADREHFQVLVNREHKYEVKGSPIYEKINLEVKKNIHLLLNKNINS